MNRRRSLALYAGLPQPDSDVEAGPTPLWAAVYTEPNPDGSRKKCDNCVLYVRAKRECSVHEPGMAVTPDAVCAYHIYGRPMTERPDHPDGQEFLDPELSGLEQVPGGVGCDLCRWYTPLEPNQGKCRAVLDEGTGASALVHARGCCARWEDGGPTTPDR